MTARSHSRGWPIEYDGIQWVFSDTCNPDDSCRPCRRCGHGVKIGFVNVGGYQPTTEQVDLSDIEYPTCDDTIDGF